MARTQSKNYSEIRESILRSAAKLFAVRGYPNTSIVDLADACNSSRGALYHYFESKEQILTDILETHLETVLGELQTIELQQHDPLDNFRALMRRLMMLNSQNQAEQITLLNETNQLDETTRARVAAKQREIVNLIVEALSRLDSQKRMTTSRRKVYGMMLLGALNYTYAWYDPSGPISPEAYADMTVEAFVRGFANPDPIHAADTSRDATGPRRSAKKGATISPSPLAERRGQMRKEIV